MEGVTTAGQCSVISVEKHLQIRTLDGSPLLTEKDHANIKEAVALQRGINNQAKKNEGNCALTPIIRYVPG